ncbi:MAG TPA: DUF4893 domain-containing protein [Sphingomonadaceae bacterium]|nr:DUF4893 domain-containing protein [Sphingomonadaceae bacterium]
MTAGCRVVVLMAFLGLSACHHGGRRPGAVPPPLAWHDIATSADRARLHAWREAWTVALAKVAKSGETRQVVRQAELLQPDAALRDPVPPPGDYRCRTFKLGAKQAGGLDFVAYQPFTCRIEREGDVLSFAKIGGSQRPVGLLFPDDAKRMVFLGTMTLGDESRALDYGRDPERDVAGLLERVDAERWRLVLPYPHWESTLDVIELTPTG